MQDAELTADVLEIPTHLHHARQLYKRATTILLDYLVTKGRENDDRTLSSHTLTDVTVKELLACAEYLLAPNECRLGRQSCR